MRDRFNEALVPLRKFNGRLRLILKLCGHYTKSSSQLTEIIAVRSI